MNNRQDLPSQPREIIPAAARSFPVARDAAELEPYAEQLESRFKGLYKRRKLVRIVYRKMQQADADARRPPAEETGQLLFADQFLVRESFQ